MADDSFSLLRLPEDALQNVLRIMEPIQQCNFSLCSRVTKNLVKSLNLRIEELTICFYGRPFIVINFVEDLQVLILFYSQGFPASSNVDYVHVHYNGEFRAGADDTRYQWQRPGYHIRDWLIHFTYVFGNSKLDTLRVCCNMFSVNSILESVRGLDINCLKMLDDASANTTGELLNRLPRVNILKVNRTSALVMKIIRSQSYDRLCFRNAGVTISDLMMTHCAHLSVEDNNITEKYLNRFLKLWMRGCMNPSLKKAHLWLQVANEGQYLNDALTMAGVKYEVNVEQRTFPRAWNAFRQRFYPGRTVEGGFNITRDDGIKATLVLTHENEFWPESHFRMFVWD